MMDPKEQSIGNQGYIQQAQICPKYNWIKMDPYERVGVNVMDAVGAQNAVIGGIFGLFIFAIVTIFFRKQVISLLSGEFFGVKKVVAHKGSK